METSQVKSHLTRKPDSKAGLDHREVIERIDQTLDLIADATNDVIENHSVDRVDVSIILPVCNQRDRLPIVLARISQIMPVTTETIVIDDGSTDGTSEWLATLPHCNSLKIIRRRRNHGKGSAIRVGIRHSQGRVIAIQDANLQYDPADLLHVIWPVLDGDADVVYGSRYLEERSHGSELARLGKWLWTSTSNAITGLGLTDVETCHRAFDGDLLRSIPLRERGRGFDFEITAKIAKQNMRLIEVPTHDHALGITDQSQVTWRDRFDALKCLWNYRRG